MHEFTTFEIVPIVLQRVHTNHLNISGTLHGTCISLAEGLPVGPPQHLHGPPLIRIFYLQGHVGRFYPRGWKKGNINALPFPPPPDNLPQHLGLKQSGKLAIIFFSKENEDAFKVGNEMSFSAWRAHSPKAPVWCASLMNWEFSRAQLRTVFWLSKWLGSLLTVCSTAALPCGTPARSCMRYLFTCLFSFSSSDHLNY